MHRVVFEAGQVFASVFIPFDVMMLCSHMMTVAESLWPIWMLLLLGHRSVAAVFGLPLELRSSHFLQKCVRQFNDLIV